MRMVVISAHLCAERWRQLSRDRAAETAAGANLFDSPQAVIRSTPAARSIAARCECSNVRPFSGLRAQSGC